MGSVALAVRILLAVVFAAAALGKLLDQPGSRRALADFGMPVGTLTAAALLLPIAELATAIALIVHQSARWGAIAALVLLALFVTGIAGAMIRGQAPDCHCFGQLSSSPAGRGTLVRNVALAGAAAFIVAYGPGKSISSWISGQVAADLGTLAAVAAVACAAFCIRLWLDNRELQHDFERSRTAAAAWPAGLPIGTPAPAFSVRDVDGGVVTLEKLLGLGKPVALVFVSSGCHPCREMFPQLALWQRTLAEKLTIALLATGSVSDNQRMAVEHGLSNVLVQERSEVFDAYRAMATPSTVIVTPAGTIGSKTSSTQALVEALIRQALRAPAATGSAHGEPSNGGVVEVRQWSGAQASD